MAEDTGNDYEKALFANLVMMLSSSAMQQLGLLMNPLTNKAEMNLEAAQMTIDMLTTLQKKTAGNLDADEERMFADAVASLQMNFVEKKNAAAEAGSDVPGPSTAEPEPDADADTNPVESAGAREAKDPKYHKSYGD